MGATFPQALIAGVTGTVALRALVALRNRVLGGPPPYAARHIAARLARSTLHVELSPAQARRWGDAMRAIYGPMLGVGWALARESAPAGPVPPGLLLGLGVLALELSSFPVLRATESPRGWSIEEHAWLVAQTAVFGLVTEAMFTSMTR
ncbi:hypothetical protein HPC49_00175 [Pyxidicoccus fallax]|uniref:Uncharacterized protein n=1 Tax=Pyxidicoccus fallax TaxID=394095 RepID=A0A848LET1_9BACT|nr:hypothetical protein [Pyxidicoccus fallax]NMO13998.1 hypothetical protein [Pyxidicoccus fallax]NPC76670.1 hypothetical protein [Pyxidicoccus fallax]